MDGQLDELIGFLKDPKPEVRMIAAQYLVGFTTPKSDQYTLTKTKFDRLIPGLMNLCKDPAPIAHQALRGLINASGDDDALHYFDHSEFLTYVGTQLVLPTCAQSDLFCMLLANVSKHEPIARALVNISSIPPTALRSAEKSDPEPLLAQFCDAFVRGMDKQYNPDADYNFLASIFANVTAFPFGRDFFMGDSTDKLCDAPITKLMVFTDHPNLVRRSGVLSTIKNCAFETSKHHLLLDEDGMNILPYLLLPLCGSEEFSEEDMDGMPDDIQLLPPDKQREPSEHLRKILVEILVLLTGTREGREYLRLRKVYPVVRTLHLWEKDEDVQEAIERLVQMLMGDETGDTISQSPELQNQITEV
ncbi:Protein hgh1 [Dispira parvispora]|uniref:Protein HGH1 homolog n=1 Tax=Dispira parvispora TaxID=1520584 RepID=A0A9W8AY56_9FUNG|nr:Protein hgh1 [Dispira parvispora]